MEIKKLRSIFGGKFSIELTLEDGLKHILGPFTSEEKAIEAIGEFEKREYGEPQTESKALSPFDMINSFYRKKNPFDNMNTGQLDLNLKAYSQFVINKALSMTQENALAAADISSFNLSDYAHAAYWSSKAIKPRRFSKWVKAAKIPKGKSEAIKALSEEFTISASRATEYYEILELQNDK